MEEYELSYSTEGAINRFLFYSDNDINIFVEDIGREYEYEEIFSELLNNDNLKITAVFATGGKTKSKELFNELGEYDIFTGKPNLFIVDGDFDRIINLDDMIDSKHFIYLPCYNIENYIIDEQVCIHFMCGRLQKRASDVNSIIAFDVWKDKIVTQATKLYELYCYIQFMKLPIPNSGRSPYEFIDHTTGFERQDGYSKIYDEAYALDSDIIDNLSRVKGIIRDRIDENPYFFICGKFLFVSLFQYLSSLGGRKFSKEDLRWDLIRHFDVRKLEFLRIGILDCLVRST